MSERATVAVQRVTSYQPEMVEQGVRSVVDRCGGWNTLVRPGDRVLVKPNCISAQPPTRPAQTHPSVILEVCRQLIDFGARPFIGDSPAWGSLHGCMRALGITDDLERLGVELVPFKRPVKAQHPHGKVFSHLIVDAAALEADAIVNLPKFKAHRQLLMTVVIKNMFGCVGGRRKAWWHLKAGNYENYFGLMLAETFELLRPAISIVDGIVAMEGKGPISGTPKSLNLLMASTDGPALERIAAEIVGVKPARLRTLRAARELEIGTPYLERIDLDGPSLSELRIDDFDIPSLLPIGFSLPRVVRGTLKQVWLEHQQNRAEHRRVINS